jgi:hypothetical protein
MGAVIIDFRVCPPLVKCQNLMFSGFIDTLMYGFSSTGVTIYRYFGLKFNDNTCCEVIWMAAPMFLRIKRSIGTRSLPWRPQVCPTQQCLELVGSSLVQFLERMTFSWCQYGRMVSGMTCCVIVWFFGLLELACFPCWWLQVLCRWDWNLLAPDIVELDTPEAFKARIVSL